jgi:ketosteroid isomerase-like protein
MATVVSVEEHWALENALLDYLFAVDAMDDIDAMVACFTEDAVVDLTGLDLGTYVGSEAIAGFYSQVFETMSHHMHTLSNFRVMACDGKTAQVYAYICGMGRSNEGVDIQVYVYYDLKMRMTDKGWKISHFYEAPKLPMPDSVGQVHKND